MVKYNKQKRGMIFYLISYFNHEWFYKKVKEKILQKLFLSRQNLFCIENWFIAIRMYKTCWIGWEQRCRLQSVPQSLWRVLRSPWGLSHYLLTSIFFFEEKLSLSIIPRVNRLVPAPQPIARSLGGLSSPSLVLHKPACWDALAHCKCTAPRNRRLSSEACARPQTSISCHPIMGMSLAQYSTLSSYP